MAGCSGSMAVAEGREAAAEGRRAPSYDRQLSLEVDRTGESPAEVLERWRREELAEREAIENEHIRAAVADELQELRERSEPLIEALQVAGDYERARGIRQCVSGRYWRVYRHQDCGELIRFPLRCHDRLCPLCQKRDGLVRRRKIRWLCRRALSSYPKGKGPPPVKLLTISPENVPLARLREFFRALGKLLRWIRHSSRGKLEGDLIRGGAAVFEVTWGRVPGLVNAHVHIAIEAPDFAPTYGEWQERVSAKWAELFGTRLNPQAVRIDPFRHHRDAVPEELSKYLTKVCAEGRPWLAVEVSKALKGMRRLITFGSWYNVRVACRGLCGADISPDARVCPECNFEQEARPVCPHCDAAVSGLKRDKRGKWVESYNLIRVGLWDGDDRRWVDLAPERAEERYAEYFDLAPHPRPPPGRCRFGETFFEASKSHKGKKAKARC